LKGLRLSGRNAGLFFYKLWTPVSHHFTDVSWKLAIAAG
jgi:hypothetical protein